MSKFKQVEGRVSFPEIEDKVNNFWKDNKIFEKSVEQKSEDDRFIFVDGPPFVSGTPHYGTLLVTMVKDVIPRFQTMRGKKVRRVFGWDCHGLPIEEKINKKFNLKGRKQIEEEFGVERYVKECKSYVESCITDWRWYIEKVGRWVDLDNAYYTMYPEFNESVIWAFKQIYDKGYVYKGKRTSLFSTDTSTPVSEFEVAMDPDNYKEVEDLSIYVKFQVSGESKNKISPDIDEDIYLLAWTTTPWTIPSNFALAVNPDADYVLVEFENQYYVCAKELLERVFETDKENIGNSKSKLVKLIDEFKGTKLKGVKYTPIYDFFKEKTNNNDYTVYEFDGVTTEDGTGILHVAPAFGADDHDLGKKYNLSDFEDIDEEGKMTVGDWKGIYLRKASSMITEDLLKKGNLLRSHMYSHRVPFYRGENPLIYKAQDAYFIDIQSVKKRMLELNKDVNWYPEHFKTGRFNHVIENSPDWGVSRNRYWATIMPLWQSDDGEELVVGSIEELTKYTDQIQLKEENGEKKYYYENEEFRLHRDHCDNLVLNKDGKEFRRVPEVLDVWMDSGAVPFAEYHYPFENKSEFNQVFPSDFIVEYTGQIRAWFNVLLRVSALVFDKAPFQNVLVTGVLAGNDGRKMSKSFGNYPDPETILENVGGESLRLYLMGSSVMNGEDMSWSDEVLKEQQKNILIPIWNTYKYLTIYANLHHWSPKDTNFNSDNSLDKWIESYLQKTTNDYSNFLENYSIPESVKLIQPAIDNISSWWIRRSRERFVSGDTDALQTLYASLIQFLKTFAPQMPFITEELYQRLVVDLNLESKKESIHLEDYPEVKDITKDQEKLLEEMEVIRGICSVGLNIRVEKGIKLRQPLNNLFINSKVQIKNENLFEIVKEELNVKNIEITDNILPTGTLETKDEENFSIALDTNITQDLLDEGIVIELKRQIQNVRKQSGYKIGDLVNVTLSTKSDYLKTLIEKNIEELKKGVTASEINIVEDIKDGKSIKLGDVELLVKIV